MKEVTTMTETNANFDFSKKSTYSIAKEVGTINKRTDRLGNTWYKKVRFISWNGGKCLLDIREWSKDDSICREGMRLNWKEIDALTDLLVGIREEQQRERAAEKADMAGETQSIPQGVSENMESTL